MLLLLLHLAASVAVDQETRVRWTLAEDDEARRLLATASTMQHLLHHPVVLLHTGRVLGAGHDYLRLGRFPRHLVAMVSLCYVTLHSDIPADYHTLNSSTAGPVIACPEAERLRTLHNLRVLELGNDRVAGRALDRNCDILMIAFAVILCCDGSI